MGKLRFAPLSGMSWVPALIVVLTFLAYTINNVSNYIALTSTQAAYIGLAGFILAGLVTLFTTEEEQAPFMTENMSTNLKGCK